MMTSYRCNYINDIVLYMMCKFVIDSELAIGI